MLKRGFDKFDTDKFCWMLILEKVMMKIHTYILECAHMYLPKETFSDSIRPRTVDRLSKRHLRLSAIRSTSCSAITSGYPSSAGTYASDQLLLNVHWLIPAVVSASIGRVGAFHDQQEEV